MPNNLVHLTVGSAVLLKIYSTNDKSKVYPVYLGDILNKGNLESNYSLRPSDVVTVPERAF